MKKFLQNLRKAKKKAEAMMPRPLPEIQKDATGLFNQLGQAQYQVYVYEQAVKNLNKRLESVNQEAAARKELDAKAEQEKNSAKIDEALAKINETMKEDNNEVV